MRRIRGCVISNFICPVCGTVIPLPRNHGRLRANGHIKDIFCPKCNSVKKFKEVTYKNCYKNMDGEYIINQ